MAAQDSTKPTSLLQNGPTPTWHEKSAAKRIGVSTDEYLSRIALGMKWCSCCKEWHSRFIFTIDRIRYDGLASSCRNALPVKHRVSEEQKRENRRNYGRRYYNGKGGPSIRAQKAARKRRCEVVTPHHRELVFERFDGLCAYCGDKADTIDHVIPVSRGGGSGRGNLLPACALCNTRKRTKGIERFLDECGKRGQFISNLIGEELAMEGVL